MKIIFLVFLFVISGISLPFAYMPARIEVVESADTSVTYNITLISNKSVTEEVDLGLSTWEVKEDQFLFYPFDEKWVNLSKSHLTLIPGGTQILEVGVKVPTSSGERRFEIDFTSELANTSFRVSKAVPIYLVTEGTEKMGCLIISFDILKEGDSLRASYVIENVGNVHIRPRIEIQFEGNPNWIRMQDDMPVYPYSRRRFGADVPWPESKKEGAVVNVRLQYSDTHGQIQTILEKVVVN